MGRFRNLPEAGRVRWSGNCKSLR